MIKLYQGKCEEVLKNLPENSIDAIVTDPPYGLSFMGKKWDYEVPSVELWKEALRVLKPGGTALIFAGSRTQHRMAINVEDAGFFLKDCIMWIYGSGFPKSTDISKQIDKAAGAEREKINTGNTIPNIKSGNYKNSEGKNRLPEYEEKPATTAAQLWEGYGTALKPAYEPIIVAMKPNDGTYANNALKHGVAGLNIDGCRIKVDNTDPNKRRSTGEHTPSESIYGIGNKKRPATLDQGRFPSNIIHDGSEDVLNLFPDTKSGGGQKQKGGDKINPGGWVEKNRTVGGNWEKSDGSAARFFYTAKASKSERNKGIASHVEIDGQWEETKGNNHPTVKPLSLIRYLIRLVKTPTETVILDNFMGSGTFGEAAHLEGVSYFGIEKEPEYFKIAQERINQVTAQLSF